MREWNKLLAIQIHMGEGSTFFTVELLLIHCFIAEKRYACQKIKAR